MGFKKILCPVDFSPGSLQAMRVAVRLANEHDAELTLVHTWYLPPVAFSGEYMYAPDLIQQLTDDAEHGLETALAEASKLGARRVSSRLVTGVPWQQIVDSAGADPAFDLIVIGSHGRTGLTRVLLGSVAEMVLRHAPCPVLTVRPDSEPAPFVHVLCPVDFSTSSRDAVNLAAELARPGGAGITLLHVLELPVASSGEPHVLEHYRDFDARSTALLDQWTKELLAKTAVPVTQRTRIGHPGAQTLAVLDDGKFDLVVMGSHGRSGIARMLLGSVAEKVTRHAPCPALVARRHTAG